MAFSFVDKHWNNADEVDAVMQVPVCRAFTTVSDSTEPIEMSLSYPKDGKTLPMIRLQTRLAAPRIDAKISSSVTETLFLLKTAAGPEDTNIYWYAPVNFSRFENYVREAMTLQVTIDPKGQPLMIKVSLSGSNNALNQVVSCLKGVKAPTEFLKLLNTKKDALTPDLGDRSVTSLRQSTEAAYAAYLAGQGTAAALAQLQKPFANLIAKETSAKKLVVANQEALRKAQTALDNLNQELATLPGKIAQQQADLASFKQQKPGADADLKQKKATYQTLLPQMAPYSKAITEAAGLVKKIQDSITAAQALIVKNTKKIETNNADIIRLTNALPTLRSRVNRTADSLNRAAAAYNNFNVSWEIDNRLRSDFSYRNAQSSLESDERRLRDEQSKLQDAERRLSDAQRDLSTCLGNPATSANCSSQQSAVSSASSAVTFAEWDVRSAQNRVDSDRSDMERARNSIVREVESEESDLASAYNSARSAYDDASGELSYAQSRIKNIPGENINLQAAIDKATADIPVFQTNLIAAQAQLVTVQANYDQFAKQIGFDVATAEYQAAQKLADSINKGISDLTASIPVLQKQLKKDQANLPQTQKTAQQAQVALTASQQKLAPIQEQLKPYYEQAAPLLAKQAEELLAFQTQRAFYQDLYVILNAN